MACLKKKKRSPYWWIKYRDASGKLREESTSFLHDLAEETRKARAMKAQKTAEELSRQPARSDSPARWERWVPIFLETRYAGQEETLTAYQTRWANIEVFLSDRNIPQPQFFRREHADHYMQWRQKGDKPHHIRPAHHNTARMELKLLSLIINEAIEREYADKNPLLRLGIKKIPPKEKPEMTDAEILLAREELSQWPSWMGIALEVGTYTGCRLSETNVILDDVDTVKKTSTFRDPKGGKGGNKDYTVPLRDELIPLFEKLKRDRPGRGQRAYEALPPDGASEWWTPARAFHRFFKCTPGLQHLTFHCTRVTFVTRGARDNVPIAKMMKMVNHATELIHRIYQRLNVEDLQADSQKMSLPPGPEV